MNVSDIISIYKIILIFFIVTCREINDCGDYGLCIGPNTCFCYSGYTGNECSEPPDYSIIYATIASQNGTITASASQNILLDASGSFDRYHSDSILLFEWNCIDTTFPELDCPLKGDDLLSVEPTQLIGSHMLTSGHHYIWTVTVSNEVTSSYASVNLILNHMVVPNIEVTITPPGQLYSVATIIIEAISSENIATWTWMSLDYQLDLDKTFISSTETSSVLQIPSQTVEGEISIYLEGRTSDGRAGSQVINLNIIPTTSGYCTVVPYENGMTISTEFNLYCAAWRDDVGGRDWKCFLSMELL